MMEKYQGKYRIPSARLAGYDYSQAGAYFITICTAKRAHHFGEIVPTPDPAHQTMDLNAIGHLATHFWSEIPHHFPSVELGAHIVMPNHVHGILIIHAAPPAMAAGMDAGIDAGIVETPDSGVSTTHASTPTSTPAWKPGTIGVIINQYKRIVTIHARKIQPDFGWQARFHDHIIRHQASFERIQTYILNNPANWQSDTFHDTSI